MNNKQFKIGKNSKIITGSSVAKELVYKLALEDLQRSIQEKFGIFLEISLNMENKLEPDLIIIGRPSVNKHTKNLIEKKALSLPDGMNPESFIIKSISVPNGKIIVVSGQDTRGDIYGIYHLIEIINVSKFKLSELDIHKSPAFTHRLVIGVGPMFSHDPRDGVPDSWSEPCWRTQLDITWHSGGLLHGRTGFVPNQVVRVRELERAVERFKEFCQNTLKLGYNSVMVGGINHLVNLEEYNLYSKNSEYFVRHKVYRRCFKEMIDYASKLQLDFWLWCWEFAYTRPMEEKIGKICPANPKLWEIYKARFREVLNLFPQIKGVFVMSGDLRIRDFQFEIGYLWEDLIRYHWCPDCEHLSLVDRSRMFIENTYDVVVRECKRSYSHTTWGWGVPRKKGARYSTSVRSSSVEEADVLMRKEDVRATPELYDKIFSDYAPRENFAPAMFYTFSDWYCYQPLNPNLGRDRYQEVMFQCDHEKQGQGLFPWFNAEEYQRALKFAYAKGIRRMQTNAYQGAVTWKVGPEILMFFKGFWKWIHAVFYAQARLAWNPEENIDEIAKDWAKTEYGIEAADNIAKILLMSAEVIEKGIYVKSYAEKNPTFPNPIVRWMLVFDGDVLKDYYLACKDNLDESISDSVEAYSKCNEMIKLLEEVKPVVKDKELYANSLYSLNHEKSFMELMMYYRGCFLRFYHAQELKDSKLREKELSKCKVALGKLMKSKRYYEENYDVYLLDGIQEFIDKLKATFL